MLAISVLAGDILTPVAVHGEEEPLLARLERLGWTDLIPGLANRLTEPVPTIDEIMAYILETGDMMAETREDTSAAASETNEIKQVTDRIQQNMAEIKEILISRIDARRSAR